MATILAVCLSKRKGARKQPVESGTLLADLGIEGDAHAGTVRQVSLLGIDSIRKMERLGLETKYGMFAENLVVDGIRIEDVEIGQVYILSSGAEIKVTQIGKTCHTRCEIYESTGDCIMPREGFFARILKGGSVKAGDRISRMQVNPPTRDSRGRDH